MTMQYHPFHIVFISPWPILVASSTFSMLTSSILMMAEKNTHSVFIATASLIINTILWWRDVSRESSFQGFHTNLVMNGLRWGMALFIVSEVLFFFSFFWTFFHSSLAPNFEMGMLWPPLGTQAINPYQVPLLNTVVLLSSGISVTLSHHAMIKNKSQDFSMFMMMTIMLGIYFSTLQGWEYWESSFSFSDSSFGSSFFLATGFHGAHVLIGSLFLFSSLMRFFMNIMSNSHHLNTEMAIWYWHFVDVVWLFLYSFIYWWAF